MTQRPQIAAPAGPAFGPAAAPIVPREKHGCLLLYIGVGIILSLVVPIVFWGEPEDAGVASYWSLAHWRLYAVFALFPLDIIALIAIANWKGWGLFLRLLTAIVIAAIYPQLICWSIGSIIILIIVLTLKLNGRSWFDHVWFSERQNLEREISMAPGENLRQLRFPMSPGSGRDNEPDLEPYPLVKNMDEPFDLVVKVNSPGVRSNPSPPSPDRQLWVRQAMAPNNMHPATIASRARWWIPISLVSIFVIMMIALVTINEIKDKPDKSRMPENDRLAANAPDAEVHPSEIKPAQSYSNSATSNRFPPVAASTQPSAPAGSLPVPKNGQVTRFIKIPSIAPFEIKTEAGANYLVRLKTLDGTNVLEVFVIGGRTIKINVPLGAYKIVYASGQDWYGDKIYFGPDTSFKEAVGVFTFAQNGTQVTGYAISLYRVVNGNLKTENIKKEKF